VARYTGQVTPYIPASAPLSYRLSEEVYALDGTCGCQTGPAVPHGKSHVHSLGDSAADLIPAAAIIGLAIFFFVVKK